MGLHLLTSIPFGNDSVIRGDIQDFFNADILMTQVICNKGEYVKIGLEELDKKIDPESDNKCLIFCNSRSKAHHYCSELESKLNNSNVVCDVIVISGALNKHKKFWRIRILLGSNSEYVLDCCFRVGVCTNACNVGIDDMRIKLTTVSDLDCQEISTLSFRSASVDLDSWDLLRLLFYMSS